MPSENDGLKESCKIARPEAKFLIGLFAGLCSTVFPRLGVYLSIAVNSSNIASDLKILTNNYIICSVIFAVIVGIAVMIIEWRVSCEPGKTFMMALSVPALLAGAFNTSSAIDLYQADQNSIVQTIQRENPIPIGQEKISREIIGFNKTEEKPSYFSLFFPGATEAHAADSKPLTRKVLAFQVRLYSIVLDRLANEPSAMARAEQLRNQNIGEARAVQLGSNQYLVILGGVKLPRAEALLRADALRRQHPNLNLKLELLPVE